MIGMEKEMKSRWCVPFVWIKYGPRDRNGYYGGKKGEPIRRRRCEKHERSFGKVIE